MGKYKMRVRATSAKLSHFGSMIHWTTRTDHVLETRLSYKPSRIRVSNACAKEPISCKPGGRLENQLLALILRQGKSGLIS